MVDRIHCKTPGCKGRILQSTADKTGGYCMPCVQKKEREKREQYIRENRKDVNLYKSVTSNVEIIKIFHAERKRDPLINYLPYKEPIEKVYSRLSEYEVSELVTYIIEIASHGNLDLIETIGLELTAFKDSGLPDLQEYLVDNHIYYPGMLFKGANDAIALKLMSRVSDKQENKNHILSALAWIDSPVVHNQFIEWKNHPPKWSAELYVPVHDYAKEAGWTITKNNEKKNLYLNVCYPLIREKLLDDVVELHTCNQADAHCEWCNNKLTKFYEFDLTQPEFKFIPFNGNRLTLATCHVCACFTDGVFMDVTIDGRFAWSKFNVMPEYLPDDTDSWDVLPENQFVMSNKPRTAGYAANEFLPVTFSQIGGMPTWIQDTAYPVCPKCSETMTLIAQLSNEDLDEYGEGIYYSYLCSSCNITATNYQQT